MAGLRTARANGTQAVLLVTEIKAQRHETLLIAHSSVDRPDKSRQLDWSRDSHGHAHRVSQDDVAQRDGYATLCADARRRWFDGEAARNGLPDLRFDRAGSEHSPYIGTKFESLLGAI